MLFSKDNTLRVQAEDILRNSDELNRLILDSASEAICGCDSEGICLFSNPSAARMLGYDHPAELLGKNMHALEHHTRKDGTPYTIGERMARAFLWSFGPILSFGKVKPSGP